MKSFLNYLKQSHIVLVSVALIVVLVVFCSIMSLTFFSGFADTIHHLQKSLSEHKLTLLLSHTFIFGAIFLIGFLGFKRAALKKDVPQKHINAFGALLVAFLVTIVVIDAATYLI
jgi:hypothetical protein